jgi:hypothetical protein
MLNIKIKQNKKRSQAYRVFGNKIKLIIHKIS